MRFLNRQPLFRQPVISRRLIFNTRFIAQREVRYMSKYSLVLPVLCSLFSLVTMNLAACAADSEKSEYILQVLPSESAGQAADQNPAFQPEAAAQGQTSSQPEKANTQRIEFRTIVPRGGTRAGASRRPAKPSDASKNRPIPTSYRKAVVT